MKQAHFREKVEYQLKGKKHSTYICGTCKVSWPCIGKFEEIRNNAIEKGEIPEGDKREYQT
jgi:hypothetical protein